MKQYITIVTLLFSALFCLSCAEDNTAGGVSPTQAASITVAASDFGGGTRAAYSGYSLSFESGDKIGVYVLGRNLLESNVCFTYNGTAWVPEKNIEYCEEYTYYAYYPYVADAYAPDFSGAEIDDMFAEYITDEGNKFHKADQSVKANFNASDLMIGSGVCDGNGAVAFTLDHKKGLAVFEGSYDASIFSGDNLPYTVGSKGYYMMKADTAYAFTDVNGGYILYASRGKYTTHDVPAPYLTFVAREDGTFSFSKAGLSYSLDGGTTWTALAAGASTPTVQKGREIMWKNNTTLTPTSSEGIGTFSSTAGFDAKGNIMSLYYGDDATGQTDLTGKNYAFMTLFRLTKLVNANELQLPATTLADYCYQYMFNQCYSLTTAPKLPATTLANYCYKCMFYTCTSLTSAPELPATTLADYCYHSMFNTCSSLTAAPKLPATTLSMACYASMFGGCTSLTAAPELPATTLNAACYWGMFSACRSLTAAPELPATTINPQCYQNMFENCRALTTAPELPATTLMCRCYQRMFYGCTALTTAPELPATTLESDCYKEMFYNCSSLNTVTAAFTTEPSTSYTTNWLSGVAATGTFYKNSAASWDVTGANGIPSGWTVNTYTP